jgi:prolyl oligopeptidase
MPADIADPYAWLEDVHGARPRAWVAEQNKLSLAGLKSDPRYALNYDSILTVLDAADRIPYGAFRRDGMIYNFWQDAAHPKGLWRRTALADYLKPDPAWETVLDVDALARAEGENWVWEGSDCAPAGKPYCLVSLSRGGGDAVVIREFDLTAKGFVRGGFSLPEAKSSATYVNDDTAILYAIAAHGQTSSGYARKVEFWKRGDPAVGHVVYEGQPDDVLVAPSSFGDPAMGQVTLITRAVSFFESEYYAVGPEVETVRLPLPLGADVKGVTIVKNAAGAMHKELLVTLREAWTAPGGKTIAKGALIAIPVTDRDPDYLDFAGLAVLYTPGPRNSIDSVAAGRDAVYVTITDNVVGSVHVFRKTGEGWRDTVLKLPGAGTPEVIATDDFGPEVLLGFQNYLTPPTLYFDGGQDAPRPIRSLPARFDASGLVSEQFEATSKDGTKIPYFVTRPRNLAGPAPTILYGYGGFEVSLTPSYSANFGRLWLGHGGIYVVANIRGGGEFGPAWHEAALKTHRQRAYDDFAAVAQDLEKRGLTTPAQLGIMGGSNGGLLVSTVMVQHPELFGAVVCQVPLIDMMAYTHIGAGASWIGEYGDPANAAERDYILTYSPYQNVKPGVAYPPVFFVTATSDDRVTPVHARKMAAKMEAQGHQVLFYENTDGGHAAAADHKQAAEMWALSFVYLARMLGLKS